MYRRRWSSLGLVLGVAACASDPTLPGAGGTTTTSTNAPVPSVSQPATSTSPTTKHPDELLIDTSPDFTSSSETTSESASASTGLASETTTAGAGASSGDDSTSDPDVGNAAEGEAALAALDEYLDVPRDQRPALDAQPFATVPLTAAQVTQAKQRLWDDHVAALTSERQVEHTQKVISWEALDLRYDYTVFGEEPADGHSLFISLHGGGEAEASVNDEQWENQKVLYQPDEGIYLSPRAPTNTWNLWHETHIDPMFERLIASFIALEGVNPNRVYVMGYSAGGDGVYQLGPRMADTWAAASAMAGHPNEAKPFSLRNIGFTIHVGGDDTAYDRNAKAVEWRDQLDELQATDPMGYVHEVEVHAGKGHWMDLEDSVAVPWMAEFTRNPTPAHIVWYQDDILHERFYWLRNPEPVKETTIVASVAGQVIDLESEQVKRIAVRLSDELVDLEQPVTIRANGAVVFEGVVPRTIGSLFATLDERGDPTLVFPSEVAVEW